MVKAKIWRERLYIDDRYPATFSAFHKIMRDNGQTRATPLVLKYAEGGQLILTQQRQRLQREIALREPECT